MHGRAPGRIDLGCGGAGPSNPVMPERVTPRGRPACQRCELMLCRPEARRLRWWRTRRVGLVPIREPSRSVNCLSRLPFRGRRPPRRASARRGSPAPPGRPHRLRQCSRSLPKLLLAGRAPGGVGATRSAVAVEGVPFRSESEGMRWDRADAVTGRGGVPPVLNPEERKCATPFFGGARPSGRDGTGTLRVSPRHRDSTSWSPEGTSFWGGARAFSPRRPFPAHPRVFGSRRGGKGGLRLVAVGTFGGGVTRALRPMRAICPGLRGGGRFGFSHPGVRGGVGCLRFASSRFGVAVGSEGVATWLILPVVICLSQRLSHACVSINSFVL